MKNRDYLFLRIVNYSLLILTLILITILTIFTIFYSNNNLEYKYADLTEIKIKYEYEGSVTKEHIIKEVNLLFGNPSYSLIEKDLPINILGRTNIFLRKIEMDKHQNLKNYAMTLAHELVHLVHFTANERYCNFTAWKLLYESNDSFLRDAARYYIKLEQNDCVYEEYSCAGYINDYLGCKTV